MNCIHDICSNCKVWNSENVALMRVAYEAKQVDANELEQSEESFESENKSIEEYSYEDKLDEHFYEKKHEMKMNNNVSYVKDESSDYSLYESSLFDDDSD